ncbi:MAG: hypothetical protein E6H52_17010 [Betaproteobacteria bacterium]|nr:MAG: hypothetical protein E6H52_17010 [Betaproteobacteria bacterium]
MQPARPAADRLADRRKRPGAIFSVPVNQEERALAGVISFYDVAKAVMEEQGLENPSNIKTAPRSCSSRGCLLSHSAVLVVLCGVLGRRRRGQGCCDVIGV